MRSRTFMLSSLAVVLCTGLVGGVTYALFSAQSVNSSNNFTAGTVTIGNTDKTAWSTNFDNMAPGDTVSKTVTVHNTGSLDFEFVSVPSKSGALFAGTGKASVAVNNGTGTLPPGGAQDVTAAVSLPLSADNSYQAATGNLTITFYAWQTRNITSKVATVTKTGTTGTWDVYHFADGATLIPLNISNIIAFTEHRPDGSTLSFEVDASGDPNFYFNNTRPAGTYTYEIMGHNGIKYTGTISRP
jgi:predicted ribosomally synthesized peptide with SipW-like signal peptide